MMIDIIFKKESYDIMGACFHVYKTMGDGFLEAVYQECLEIEFEKRGIPFISQPELKIYYEDRELKKRYQPDFLCYDKIIIELKAVKNLTEDHDAQVHNYLHATKLQLGLLVNFAHQPLLEHKRIVMTKHK